MTGCSFVVYHPVTSPCHTERFSMRFFHTLFLVPALCLAQAPTPRIAFDKTHIDLGVVSHDEKVVGSYKVTNRGSAPLHIKEIIPSCGCSYSVVGKMNLSAGESTQIEVHFDPAGMIGSVHKSLTVISDDPVDSSVILTFEASVVREIMPSTMALFFDDIPRSGQPTTKTIRLQSGNGQKIVVTDARAPGAPYLSCTQHSDGNDVVLNISIDGSKIPLKSHRGVDNLTIRTTSKMDEVLHFHIQWNMQGNIVVTPDRITWVDEAGKELRATITLTHPGGNSFRILDAKSSTSLITILGIDKSSGAEHKFEVVMSSKAKAGGYSELLTLKLDDPQQETLEIPVIAILR